MSTLILKGVTKQFGDFYAARDISLTAEEGEFVTLLGPSGCGKTTLLKMISGFHQPDSGEIILNGKPITNLPPEKKKHGHVFSILCFVSASQRFTQYLFWLEAKKSLH
ncbi:ATP-binding cassette domain-containing protein [Providencia stuartii]|nr:ATP-binding cassette domain-containing protein [Providencia stuartii]